MAEPILQIRDLHVRFTDQLSKLAAIDVPEGEALNVADAAAKYAHLFWLMLWIGVASRSDVTEVIWMLGAFLLRILWKPTGPLAPAIASYIAAMLVMIKADLALLGIHHDLFSSEAELQAAGKPDEAEAWLRAHDLVYDGHLEAPKGKTPEDWEPVELPLFRSTKFGDDQDRPIKKSDGSWTYFGADLAYHFQKSQGVDAMIDIWGADHAGTVKRIKAAVAALTSAEGGVPKPFEVKLVQMVQLMKGGQPFKMSKRAGNFVTLADVVEMVGKDVVRFTMLTRKPDAQMDFDFDKVVEASKDNPVFYVQYANARINSVMRKAREAGIVCDDTTLATLDLSGMTHEAEIALAKKIAEWPRLIEIAARGNEPHRVAFYLYELASELHGLWNRGNDDPSLRFFQTGNAATSAAKIALARAAGVVIGCGLGILGVTPVEEMR